MNFCITFLICEFLVVLNLISFSNSSVVHNRCSQISQKGMVTSMSAYILLGRNVMESPQKSRTFSCTSSTLCHFFLPGHYYRRALNDRTRVKVVTRNMKTQTNKKEEEKNFFDEFLKSMEVDKATTELFRKLPQGSNSWLAARKYRLTASNFGSAVGHNPWTSADKLVEDMLFGNFKGNDATRWGNEKEAIARQLYILKKRIQLSSQKKVSSGSVDFQVFESGLHVWKDYPFLAASPDGIVHENGETGLVEIKCPYSLRIYNQIPEYYYDQIQGIMGILNCNWCDFVVWTPSAMLIERVPFDRNYWESDLLPKLKEFYMNKFVPKYVLYKIRQVDDWTENYDTKMTSWVGSGPLDTTDAKITNLEWLELFKDVLNEKALHQFESFAPGVLQANERMAINGLRLEYVGFSCESIFSAIVTQLQRQGLLPLNYDKSVPSSYDSPSDKVGLAARQARMDTVSHIVEFLGDFELATRRSRKQILERVGMLVEGVSTAGGLELAAAAQLFSVHIVCLVVSSTQVHERHFFPSLRLGSKSLGAARGRIVVASAGSLVWSSVPLPTTSPALVTSRALHMGRSVSRNTSGSAQGEGASDVASAHASKVARRATSESTSESSPGPIATQPAALELQLVAPDSGRLASGEEDSEHAEEPLAAEKPGAAPPRRNYPEGLAYSSRRSQSAEGLTTPQRVGDTELEKLSFITQEGLTTRRSQSSLSRPSEREAGGDGAASSGTGDSRGPSGTLPGGLPGPVFGSRFSPVFQQCVVDVAAKLKAQGADEMQAVRGAFKICSRSVGERRLSSDTVRRNGKPLDDPLRTAAAYQDLLVAYQLARMAHLASDK